ncbi:MAG TPA: acetaldehyde dehydrogenase (acetylating) [Streptosporangiaceae bacterium]|nr:acetaldehyde dehydrogenase (acetylating) [Streptosporangiaceae bacterium]
MGSVIAGEQQSSKRQGEDQTHRKDGGKSEPRLRTAIIGTGNVGTDLLLKVMASQYLSCELFAGRRADSAGIQRARAKGVTTSTHGIKAVADLRDSFDVVFDATSAADAKAHWEVLRPLGVQVIDLTPANLGKLCIPALNLDDCLGEQYVSMISCGGQAAVPIGHCMQQVAAERLRYLEIASTSAAVSVGPATRANIDEYVEVTERATREICGAEATKTILVISPAKPEVVMRNTIAVRSDEAVDMSALRLAVEDMEARIQAYVPGYRIVVPPISTEERIMVSAEVQGRGDWLPPYAGNLDIITCAGVALAEARAMAACS